MTDKLPVGVVARLAQPRVFRNTYPTASWYTDVEVPAGDYPVVTYEPGDRRTAFVYVDGLEGVVVGSLFVNRLFHASSSRVNEDVGEPCRATGVGMYRYELLKVLETGEERHGMTYHAVEEVTA